MYKKLLAIGLIILMIFSTSMTTYSYTPEVISNTFTMYRPNARGIVQLHTIDSEDKKIAENEWLILYLNEDDLSIKVLDKASQYIYSSNDVDLAGLNAFWQNYVNSPVTVKYFDSGFNLIQESINDDRNSKKVLNMTSDGFTADLYFAKGRIRLSYGVKLDGDSIVIFVDDESIVEEASSAIISQMAAEQETDKPEEELSARERLALQSRVNTSSYDLYSVTLYPFFGALESGEQDGYTLIPDGSGALIRYDKKYRGINIPYEKPFYGYDNGIPYYEGSANYTTDYYSELQFALYGMVHGIDQSGFLNIIEKGGEYGRLVSYPAGATTDFYFTTVEYTYNTNFQQRISASQTITSKLDKRNTINIQERYKFVNGENANYTGLANVYKDYLLGNNALNTYKIDYVPLSLFAVTQVLKRSLIRNHMEIVTSTDDIIEMEQYLTSQGVNQIYFSLDADKQDLTGKTSDANKLQKSVEGRYSFKRMNDYLRQNNHLSFVGSDSSYFSGSGKIETDVLRMANREYAQSKMRIGNQNYTFSSLSNEGRLKNIQYIMDKITHNGFDGFHNLNGVPPATNFGRTNSATRRQSIDTIVSTGDQIQEKGIINGSQWVYDYALKNTDISFYTIMETTMYQFITDTIPFYQIVLSGNIPMVSMSLNSSSDLHKTILHCIEYNIYPQFEVMSADYDQVDGALFSNVAIFTVQFDRWKDRIVNMHSEISLRLDQVRNEKIVKHEMIAHRIAAITYSNGKTIIVNYTDNDFVYKDVLIKGKDSVVI